MAKAIRATKVDRYLAARPEPLTTDGVQAWVDEDGWAHIRGVVGSVAVIPACVPALARWLKETYEDA